MILDLHNPADAGWFASVTLDDTLPRNSRAACARREDTSTEVLAHEIVRYMPDLAHMLAASGRRRLQAAA